jgi:acetylornithine deacetylase/succinyl-diaminopimelate desuccinylase-like protein
VDLARARKLLERYLAIPAISCDPAHAADVRKLAETVRADLEALGLGDARILELPGALPLVTAAWAHPDPKRPTVLVYGHLDLQPVAGELWQSPPHTPTERGGRLYARGAADDLGGWVSHLAAIEAWLEEAGVLPVSLRLVIESEEEIGSRNLERYMDAFPDVFSADVMVLTDCENPSTDVPGLTVSLRGVYEVEIVCEALHADIHSGLWGNLAPDPGNALILLLARLLDEHGRMKVGRVEVDEAWRRESRAIPFSPDELGAGARLLPGVGLLPEVGRSTAEWVWRQPAVTVLSTTFPRPHQHKNAIRSRASATLSIRLAPGQSRSDMRHALERALLDSPPGGVRVRLEDLPTYTRSWLYEPAGPAFDAADRAYRRAWGTGLARIGIGASIPFVSLFGQRFPGVPLILNGVMDPRTGAHGPDESLDLGVFAKSILANVYLLGELGELSG